MEDVSGIIIRDLDGLGKRNVIVGRSWGSLHEVKVCQRTCSAKRLSDVLQEVGGDGALGEEEVAVVAQRFRRECVSLSKLRHPNVLQFMGVHCGAGPFDFTLVVEHVYTSLDQCLQTHPNVDLSLKLSVLFDVSCGLLYLHTRDPPVVHRNLTASNVVLTRDMMGKIADLRVSKVFDLETQVSRLPEGLMYMPPEVLANPSSCDVKMDIFSFGVLCLFVVNQGLPAASSDERLMPAKNRSQSLQLRRQCALDKVDKRHPLYPVIIQCLLESGDMRLAASEVNRIVQVLSAQHPRRFKDIEKGNGGSEGRRHIKGIRKQPKGRSEVFSQTAQKKEKSFTQEKNASTEQSMALVPREGNEQDSTSKLCAALEKLLALKTENDRLQLECTQNASSIQALQTRIAALEEEKCCVQLVMQRTCLELVQRVETVQSETAAVKGELHLKRQEIATLQMALEQQRDAFWVKERRLQIELQSARVSPHARDGQPQTRDVERVGLSHYEDVDGAAIIEIGQQNKQLKLKLDKLNDECESFKEQSKQQKEQIDLYASAADEVVRENQKLKKQLKQEKTRVEELAFEVNGLRKDMVELSNAHGEEKEKRMQLERNCLQLESLQALHHRAHKPVVGGGLTI